MAGKNQHYLWQMIQRGFATRGRDGLDHLWYHEKDQAPRMTTTRKVGAEKDFYGKGGYDADENITRQEGLLQGLIINCRKAADSQVVDAEEVATLIALTEMRGIGLRRGAKVAFERLLGAFSGNLADEDFLWAAIEPFVDKLLDEQSNGLARSQVFRDHLKKMIRSDGLGAAAGAMRALSSSIVQAMPDMARNGQNSVLTSDFSLVGRRRHFRDLQFRVLVQPEGGLILPDGNMLVIAGNRHRPMHSDNCKVDEVMFPVSDDRLIWGGRGPLIRRPTQTINKLLADVSAQFFVSRDNQSAHRKLAARIGRCSELFEERALTELASRKNLLAALKKAGTERALKADVAKQIARATKREGT